MNETTREKQLIRYLSALERGDFKTAMEVLAEAEDHPELETLILDYEAHWIDENAPLTEAELAAAREFAPPPVTVGAVARMLPHSPAISTPRLRRQAALVEEQLGSVGDPLPDDISDRSIDGLLERLGVSNLSGRIRKLFRSTAQILQQNQQQQSPMALMLGRSQDENRPRQESADE